MARRSVGGSCRTARAADRRTRGGARRARSRRGPGEAGQVTHAPSGHAGRGTTIPSCPRDAGAALRRGRPSGNRQRPGEPRVDRLLPGAARRRPASRDRQRHQHGRARAHRRRRSPRLPARAAGLRPIVLRLAVAAVVGGFTGAALLLVLPERVFELVAPVLIAGRRSSSSPSRACRSVRCCGPAACDRAPSPRSRPRRSTWGTSGPQAASCRSRCCPRSSTARSTT